MSLIGSGATRKYLLYAIGEVILVMVGILLALQVNNWNEERKKDKMTVIIYQELINNIQLDIDDLKKNMRTDSSVQSSISFVLNVIEEKPAYNDSLMPYHFGGMSKYTNFYHHKSAYENLKSIGLNLITNDSLRFAIIKFYDETCNYLLNVEKTIINPHEDNFIKPFMMEHFDYSSFSNPAYPIDYFYLLTQVKLKSILATKQQTFVWKKRRGQMVLDAAEKLIIMINSELQEINATI
jgi:hypothetical protein